MSFEEMRAELKTLKVDHLNQGDEHQKWLAMSSELIGRHGQRAVEFWESEIASGRLRPRKCAAIQVAVDQFKARDSASAKQLSQGAADRGNRIGVIGIALTVIAISVSIVLAL